ncbi:MAG: Hpt domain-containing protein [Rhodospirillales bacterium]|nr:Hpt domain-containing protein [Rhodospirillales bacterium]
MADEEKPKIITPPNTLKSKVKTGGPGAVDEAALERAEAVIEGLTGSYLEWVQDDLKKLQAAFDQFVADNNAENLDKIFQISHDIKGQGGSFGYKLMTAVGNELCRFIEKTETVTPQTAEAIRLHVETLKIIIGRDLKGDGGKEGEALLVGLQQVSDKLLEG